MKIINYFKVITILQFLKRLITFFIYRFKSEEFAFSAKLDFYVEKQDTCSTSTRCHAFLSRQEIVCVFVSAIEK